MWRWEIWVCFLPRSLCPPKRHSYFLYPYFFRGPFFLGAEVNRGRPFVGVPASMLKTLWRMWQEIHNSFQRSLNFVCWFLMTFKWISSEIVLCSLPLHCCLYIRRVIATGWYYEVCRSEVVRGSSSEVTKIQKPVTFEMERLKVTIYLQSENLPIFVFLLPWAFQQKREKSVLKE